ncbi:hypothetical protein JCM10450v2_000741 [Rhodotorula kratochvilovae]
MDSLFGRTAAHPYHRTQPVALPDYDAFDAPSDDDDDDSDHGHARARRGAHSPTLSEYSTPIPPSTFDDPLAHFPATASSSSSSSSALPPLAHPSSNARTPVLPGGYDFEPQEEPSRAPTQGPPPGVPFRSRPASLRSAYGASADESAAEADDDADRYGRSPAAGAAGALGGWRGIVARLRGQGAAASAGTGDGAQRGESHGLLFSQDESDDTDAEGAGRATYPPGRGAHIPLPARPPQFAPPTASSSSGAAAGAAGGRVFGGGQGNDGVFANLAAKPDNNGDDIVGEGPGKDEVLPAYEAAQLDPSPQYWETTVITPGGLYGPDDILVDGLPVGNFFSFAWNLLVSMSFQFVGFLLTFILHTTHAAKNGSRAGLGVTLIQLGFYLKQRVDHPDAYLLDPNAPGDETGLNGGLGPADMDGQRWSWWGGFDDPSADGGAGAGTATLSALGSLPTQVGGALAGMLDASDPDAVQSALPSLQGDGVTDEEMMRMSLAANEWMAFVMVTVGSFLLIGSCLAYWRAVRYARAIRAGQGPGADAENMVAA